jgi:hypothetical protein
MDELDSNVKGAIVFWSVIVFVISGTVASIAIFNVGGNINNEQIKEYAFLLLKGSLFWALCGLGFGLIIINVQNNWLNILVGIICGIMIGKFFYVKVNPPISVIERTSEAELIIAVVFSMIAVGIAGFMASRYRELFS